MKFTELMFDDDEGLQCDRAFDGAEMYVLSGKTLNQFTLQCDRAFDGAEMGLQQERGEGTPCFNVTALLMARKFAWTSRGAFLVVLLQCDRAFDGAEMPGNPLLCPWGHALQCDRAFDGAEIWEKPTISMPTVASM